MTDATDIEQAMNDAIAAIEQRIATVHERHPCPACQRQTGERCTHIGRAATKPLRHPHQARLRLDGIPLR